MVTNDGESSWTDPDEDTPPRLLTSENPDHAARERTGPDRTYGSDPTEFQHTSRTAGPSELQPDAASSEVPLIAGVRVNIWLSLVAVAAAAVLFVVLRRTRAREGRAAV